MRDMLAEKNTQLQKMQRDLQENGREQERMERRRAELAAEIENWGALSEQANEVLVDLQRRYEAETVRMEAARKLLEESRMFALEKRQTFTNLENEVKRLTSEKSNLFEEQANKQSAKANFAAQLAELKAAIAEKQQAAQNFVAGILTAETEIAENGNSNAAMKQEIEDLERQIALLNRDAAVYGQELHQLEVKEARLQAENEAESGKLAETFELTYEEALPYLDDTVSRAELTRSVKELRRNIVALGNVNIEAIEEYKQVRERHEFLTAQREDLLEAHESLINVIKEMDGIMTKRFRETFDLVNTNFAKTFNRLFGGGSAALLLVDPDDLLETGVDMLVQPPGKKLINYNLLSGGEKSLIGVALVLAIFQVKPSPFCILDEVDAALDEANVDRFAEYIKSFKDSTQFIVVTHRQGTMEVADRLWGVTMEKDGISKIVSVKLSDDLQQFVS
jgi:chromosome segregation protein